MSACRRLSGEPAGSLESLRGTAGSVLYRVLADTVLVIHLTFVVFVVLGGLLVLRWPQLAWLHAPAALWGAFVEFSGRICPLTPLENYLRVRSGATGYAGGFIDHYITALIYPDGLSRSMQVVLGVCVVVLNLWIYGQLLHRRLRARTASEHGRP